jgi:hypothetical protein
MRERVMMSGKSMLQIMVENSRALPAPVPADQRLAPCKRWNKSAEKNSK